MNRIYGSVLPSIHVSEIGVWPMSNLTGAKKSEITAIAEEKGLVAIFPLPTELLLDYDEPFASAVAKVAAKLQHDKTVKVLNDNGIGFVSHIFTVSKSGNMHLYIQTNVEFNDLERICLQSILRSDATRDAYCLLRHWTGKSEAPVALFETPDQADIVANWREANPFIKDAMIATESVIF